MTISRTIFLRSHGREPSVGLANSTASQSSNSGWLGGSPWVPKSSLVFTSPVPNIACQTRLIATRLVSGCAGSTSHRARPSRFDGASLGNGGRNAGVVARTFSPFLSYWPRTRMNVSRGAAISAMTIAVGAFLSISALAFFTAESLSDRDRHEGSISAR